ncbi:MAG: hypothetical protein INF91_02580 [Alphaproteobacteria bacterium]|nr:hypothetical protein [Alphaproteobacteria bacterium]
MRVVRGLAIAIGLLTVLGEAGRWANADAPWFPKAVDDVVAGLLLALAGWRAGAARLSAAWALFGGIMLTTLVINADALLNDPAKPRVEIYVSALSVLVLIAAWGSWRASRSA